MRRLELLALGLLLLLPAPGWSQQPAAVQGGPAPSSTSPEHRGAEKLLEQKIVELSRLQREVDTLRQQLGRDRQILVQVQAVRVSLTKLRQLGLDAQKPAQTLATLFGVPASAVPVDDFGYGHLIVERQQAQSMLKTYKDKQALTVLAEPAIVTANNRPAHFFSGENVRSVMATNERGSQLVAVTPALKIGTEVDIVATLFGHNKVQLDVRPRISHRFGDTDSILQVAELDAHIEMELGKTLVIGGVRQTLVAKKLLQKETAEETAVYFLVSPEVMDAEGEVTANRPVAPGKTQR